MPELFGGNEMKEPNFRQGSGDSCVTENIFKSCMLVICLNWGGSKHFWLGTCISGVLVVALFDSAKKKAAGSQQL